jgi:methionyl-tRNA formyltransferase
MRILFVGAVEFSRHCLEEVLMAGGEVIAILTLPKEKAGFYSDYMDLTDVATQHHIPIYKLDKKISHPDNVALIRSLEPDVIFVFGWSQIITKEIIEIPRDGVIGTHPALLPKNRGRHPLIWALIKGLEESGLTFFYIDEGIDSGDII